MLNHESSTRVFDLTTEYFPTPLGIDAPQPRLAWKLDAGGRRGARQTAYRVTTAARREDLTGTSNLVWDSGRVESDQSVHVPYAGPVLQSRQRVWWQVMVWDERGETFTSAPSWWEMGLLHADDWQGQWIGSSVVGGPRATIPAPFLRHVFRLDKPIRHARIYATALGLYEMWLNGKRIGSDFFTPGWTDYATRVQYQVYDVTDLLKPGENGLGAILGDGWYCGYVGWRARQNYGDRPKLLAQLEVEYTDGERVLVPTDATWCTSLGPILEADLLMGESYDARLEMPGWNTADFDDRGWQSVQVFPNSAARLVARRGPAVRQTREFHPLAEPLAQSVWPGQRYIFDLGQNMVGWVRLKVSGPAGTTVTLRFAEVLNPDGTLYTVNLRNARATDTYTLKGEGEEVFEPHFTFHGFRYVEVSGFPGVPGQDAITGIVLHSDMPITGTFACSDPLLNQLEHNIEWGQRGNFLDVPTDCPQRDERLGWTGDAQVFARTAAFHMNVAPFFTKWVQDLEDAQTDLGQIPPVAPNIGLGNDGGPAWADAFTIVPWTMYLAYGDRQMLERHYPNIRRYVDHLVATSPGLIRCHPDSDFQNGDWDGYGDWLSINAETPKDLIGTAFLIYSADLLAKMAGVLGHSADQAHYQVLAEDTRQAFLRRYVTPDGLVTAQSQTAYILSLHFGLLPAELRATAVRELIRDIRRRDNHLSAGFVGSSYLLPVLTQAGENGVAYTLLNQKSWPSWLYPVTQGATTIWERWDGWTQEKGFQDPGMNSFNHYAYGAVGAWLYSVVAGLDVDPEWPGYQHMLLKPQPGGGLQHAQVHYESLYGLIVSAWRIEDNIFHWDVIIPPNTTAALTFPLAAGTAVMESGLPIQQSSGLSPTVEGAFAAQAGEYHFSAPAASLIM